MNTVEKLALQSDVNMDNSILLFQNRLVNLRHQHIRDIMSDYLHVSGRMEHVVTVCGIDFINDTKADNLNATWYSLESMTKPVIWITAPPSPPEGGDVEKIIPLLKKKVKAVILLDDSAPNTLVSNVAHRTSQITNYVDRVYTAHHIEHAVELAYTVGIPGDAVLFSPAAPQKEDVRCEDSLAMTGSRSTLNPQLSTFNFQLSIGDAFAAAVKKL